jgi:hypothetical protein
MQQLLLPLNPLLPFIIDELWNIGEGHQRGMQNVYREISKDLPATFDYLNLDRTSSDSV